jgi:hypothetical protein
MFVTHFCSFLVKSLKNIENLNKRRVKSETTALLIQQFSLAWPTLNSVLHEEIPSLAYLGAINTTQACSNSTHLASSVCLNVVGLNSILSLDIFGNHTKDICISMLSL